jgi:hypothetical protein
MRWILNLSTGASLQTVHELTMMNYPYKLRLTR